MIDILQYTDPLNPVIPNISCPIIDYERWTPITTNSVPLIKPNSYLISSYGRVYSLLSNKFKTPSISCWGYYRVAAATPDYRKHTKFSIHRVMMIEFCPVPNMQSLSVNHKDTIKTNNFLWNLEWVTNSENSLFCYRDGLRGAPNTDKGIDTNQRNSFTMFDSINIPPEMKQKVLELLNQGCNDLTIHRRLNIPMIAVTQVRHEMNNISLSSNIQGVQFNRYGETRLIFSDEQIHAICKYFQDHKDCHYRTTAELYRECLYELFGIVYDSSLHNAMSRYYKRIYRHDITDQYDY